MDLEEIPAEPVIFWEPNSRTCLVCGCVVDDFKRQVHIDFHSTINPALVIDQDAALEMPSWAEGGSDA